MIVVMGLSPPLPGRISSPRTLLRSAHAAEITQHPQHLDFQGCYEPFIKDGAVSGLGCRA